MAAPRHSTPFLLLPTGSPWQTPDATPDEIKKAYYACMKACHPDLSNNHPDSVAFCSFVNEVYEVGVGDFKMNQKQ